MISTNLVTSFGQTILDSVKAPKKETLKSILVKTLEEDTVVEPSEDDCEQCQIEKMHKTCTICGE